jgi:hypothetical protein
MPRLIALFFLMIASYNEAYASEKSQENYQKMSYNPSAPLLELNKEDLEYQMYYNPYQEKNSSNKLEKTPCYNPQWQLLSDYNIQQQQTQKSEAETLFDEIKELKQQNKLLLQLSMLNQEQLKMISEALGVNFEKSEKNQEQIQTSLENIGSKMTFIKKTIESNQSSPLYIAYQCIQHGLQLSKAVGSSIATYKVLSIAPAFIIPGWAVFLSTIGAGAAVYFLKL